MSFIYEIPKHYKMIVVADFFSDQVVGGAELTLDAVMESTPCDYFKINSENLTAELIEKNKDRFWLIGNCAKITRDCIITFVTSGAKYSKIECDYLYCQFRSSHLHKIQLKKDCDCHLTQYGKLIYGFYKNAQNIFFMSEAQKNVYKRHFPAMSNWSDRLLVQGSTFSNKALELLENLYDNKKSNNGKWAVQSGASWIKNQTQIEAYCKTKNIQFEPIGGMKPEQFLERLSEFKGLIAHPLGYDTAPRLVIEAAVLGLELDLNDNVQIKYEDWLAKSPKDLLQYLRAQKSFLWSHVKI